LKANRRVRLDDNGKLAYCDSTSTDCIGTTVDENFAADDVVAVWLRNGQGKRIYICSGTGVDAGDAIYAAADGKIDDSGTVLVGEALTTGSADLEPIEGLETAAAILGAVARTGLAQDDLAVYSIPLTEMRVTGTGALLGDSAGTPSGAFGLTVGTFGSASPILVGEAASAASVTNKCRCLTPLPVEYVAGQTVTLRVHARITGDVEVAQTIDVVVHKSDKEAGVSADLCATAAQTLTDAFADYDFTITPSGLAPGDMLDVELTGVANDTGGTANKLIEIGAVQRLCDVKG
jgi:hypothetical protein